MSNKELQLLFCKWCSNPCEDVDQEQRLRCACSLGFVLEFRPTYKGEYGNRL